MVLSLRMEGLMENDKKLESLKLILVLCCAVISGIFLSAYFVHYYGTQEQYLSSDLILSPESMRELSEDIAQKELLKPPKIFVLEDNSDKIELSFSKYQRFYRLIQEDQSLGDMQPALIDLFEHTPLITLQINFFPEKGDRGSLQTIQILKSGDYYRIHSLSKAKDQWVYYSHLGIGNQIVEILNNGTNL